MYDTILLTLDNSPADRAIIEHVKRLAAIMHSRVVLLHVATGVPAQWSGPDAGGEEVEKSRAYLKNVPLASSKQSTSRQLASLPTVNRSKKS